MTKPNKKPRPPGRKPQKRGLKGPPRRPLAPKTATGVRIGYARVSTQDQDLTMQRDALERAGCVSVYAETIGGTAGTRPQLEEAMKALRPGDTLTVWRLDRLGRSLAHLVAVIEGLRKRGVHVESLHERIDTSSATGKLTLHIFAALAEFERELIRERTRAGMAAARAQGKFTGAPRKLTDAKLKSALKLLSGGQHMNDVAKAFSVNPVTLWRAIQRHEREVAAGPRLDQPPKGRG